MDERRGLSDDRHEAKRYEIRLRGRLDSSWAEWLGGMSLTHASDGTTVLVGPVADQAALHGLLQKLRDIGVALISVNEAEAELPIARADQAGNRTERMVAVADTGRRTTAPGGHTAPTDHGGMTAAIPLDPTNRRST